MNRKHILIVSHCILNKASKVEQDEADLAAEYMIRKKLLKLVLEKDIQLIQLLCPEFIMYGSGRWGHVKDQFMTPFYRQICCELLKPVILQIQEYTAHMEKFDLMGIVAVDGSPSCGYHFTCRGDWGGELCCDGHLDEKINTIIQSDEPGVMIQVLTDELENISINIPIVSMQEAVTMIDDI